MRTHKWIINVLAQVARRIMITYLKSFLYICTHWGKPQKVLVRIINGSPKFVGLFYFIVCLMGKSLHYHEPVLLCGVLIGKSLQEREFVLVHGDHILLQTVHTGS
jgi:hypothetical protein